MRSRVRNVEDMPLRLRSRNSTRLNCEPTETISRAPFSAAISIATSWLVPGAGTSLKFTPISSRRRAARRAPVGVAVHDELGAAAKRLLAGRVHVADDHVGRQAHLQQRLGAAVDGDDHRPLVADERPQRAQVALVLDAAHDERASSGRGSRWQSAAARSARRAARAPRACARSCCARSAPAPRRSPCAGRRSRRAPSPRPEHLATCQQLAPAQHLARRCLRGAFGDARPAGRRRRQRLEQPVVGQVHEQHARFDEQLRAHVGIGPRRGRVAVEHRRDACRHQLLGGDPVEILVVDQRDVARVAGA